MSARCWLSSGSQALPDRCVGRFGYRHRCASALVASRCIGQKSITIRWEVPVAGSGSGRTGAGRVGTNWAGTNRAGASRAGAGARSFLAVLLVAAATTVPTEADAQTCAGRKVSATGATSQFALLGKIAARTAWSSKVTADPRLGSRYSTWLRGKERRIVCRKVDRRHICLAIALPCRSGGLLPATAAPTVPADPKRRPL
jgi:hypothetical protein